MATTGTLPEIAAKAVERQHWMAGAEDALQRAVERGLARLGPRRAVIERVLHGDALGHPLEAVLTDIPMGAWTTAVAFDLLARISRQSEWETAARGAIGVGLAGGLAAGVAGLADWSRLQGAERRIGWAHGMLSGAGWLAFAVSWQRRRRAGRGRWCALAGLSASLAAAELGRYLVYQRGVGVRARIPAAAEADRPRAA
ncbi:MAG: DUF2231 domain-containing protein [Terriglobales bacterium]